VIEETLAAGPLALALRWKDGWLESIRLRWRGEGEEPCPVTDIGRKVQETLERYVDGREAHWPELPVAMASLPPFFRRVLTELRNIPPGGTVSYGELAARCGSPGAARAVGQAMAKNPWPLIYPCHRVLAAGGHIGGFGPGVEMKRWLLGLEKQP
jgi:methylated-DNA-[protein]-cysteine S-methyltransferase